MKRLALCLLLALAFGDVHAHMRIYQNVAAGSFPAELRARASQHRLDLGYLNVKGAPYSAKGDGVTDDTAAIEYAIRDAYENNLVAYFPLGTYLVSRQMKLTHTTRPGSSPDTKFLFALMGQRAINGVRPVLKLKDATALPDHIFINFAFARLGALHPESHYGSRLRGIDIDMGNNPAESALRMDAAQHCYIEDVTIRGTFDVGVWNLPGSGGSTTNLTVIGGNIGVQQSQFRPSPSIQGLTLQGQAVAGIKVGDSRGPVVVVGFQITAPTSPSPTWRAVETTNNFNATEPRGNLALVDGSITSTTSQAVILNQRQDVYLRNVYVNAPNVIESGSAPVILAGSAGQWTRVSEYLFAAGIKTSTAVVNGVELGQSASDHVVIQATDSATPATDLVTRHVWSESAFPDCYQQSCVLATAFGATPDDASDDDAPAIMAALATGLISGRPVFLPRGVYHIGQTVNVPAGATLVGAADAFAVFRMRVQWQPTAATYAVLTADSATSGITLADFTVLGRQPSPTNGLASHKWISLLGLRSHDTLVRDLLVDVEDQTDSEGLAGSVSDCVYESPLVTITGHASGRIYNVAQDIGTAVSGGGTIAAGYRLLLIDGVAGPLTMYQPDIEHALTDPQAEIRNSQNVTWYAFKFEAYNELLKIAGSNNVSIVGGSGNYTLCDGDDRIIDVATSTNVTIADLGRKFDTCGGGVETPVYSWVRDGAVSAANTLGLAIFKRSP